MRQNVIKATAVISEFLTYNVTPEEFAEILRRFSSLEDNTRDREIITALANSLEKGLSS